MVDVHLKGKPQDQRISDRLKSSGDGSNPDVTVTKGTGPTRTVTHIHHGGSHLGTPKLRDDQQGSFRPDPMTKGGK